MNIEKIMTDFKTAWAVGLGTVWSGVSTVLEKIPNDIGKLATLVGIVLSCVLIYVHIKRWLMDSRSRALEDEGRQLENELKKIKLENELRKADRS